MERFIINKMADTRTMYEVKETNKKNERLIIEITECYYDEKSSLPKLWKEHRYTNKLYKSILSVNCYCYEENGSCYERYNPTIKPSEDKKRGVINFDNLLEVSEKNKTILLNKIYTNFMKAN